LIRHALRLAASTPAGTSYGVFGNYPLAVAGKTGTAQVFGKEDYSWYASFAPADNPQYVVVVLIEQGGHGGTAAAPAARLIYDALFHVKGNTVGGIGHGD
jgi:penicillin-binding protein 2